MRSIIRKNIFSQSDHLWIYFFCLCLLVISIPTSRTGINIAQILLGINWLAEGQYKAKFHKFFSNKPAIIFTLIYGLHLVSLLWTSDLNYGIGSDLKRKLPILTLTFVVATSPALDIKNIRIILYLFIATVITVALIGMTRYLALSLIDFRDMIPFISHIDYSMMLILAAFMLPWLVKQTTSKQSLVISSSAISVLMILFLFVLRPLSGIAALAGVMIFIISRYVVNHKSITVKVATITGFIATIVITILFLNHIYQLTTYKEDTDFSSLDQYTSEGNPYSHDTTRTLRENGHLVYIYLSEEELKNTWNKRSDVDYYGRDKLNHHINHTLYRYMASKGYRKDKKHMELLTDEDIRAVEKGIPNYLYASWPGIMIRIHQAMTGLQKYRDSGYPMHSTLTQRIELWKAAYNAFIKKPYLGWGPGDIFRAMKYGLEKINSFHMLPNKENNDRVLKPHNQYLLIMVTFGSIGFIMYLFFYTYTVVKTRAYKILPFNIFIIGWIIFLFGNNQLEVQFGQIMFLFFTLFFCFIYPKNINSTKN